jgi:hypothetical protein
VAETEGNRRLLRLGPVALAIEVKRRDLRTSPGTIANLTSADHLTFAAGRLPVGIALLLSASPLAWLSANFGWRSAFLISRAWGMPMAMLVRDRLTRGSTALPRGVAGVLRLAGARSLRDFMIAAFASLAVVLVIRGVCTGPWPMDVKGATRMQAGAALLRPWQ